MTDKNADICPYCGKPSRKGYISAQNRLVWTPEKETNRGPTVWSTSRNSVVLSEYWLLKAAKVTAWYCEECKKIVIDIGKNPADKS